MKDLKKKRDKYGTFNEENKKKKTMVHRQPLGISMGWTEELCKKKKKAR